MGFLEYLWSIFFEKDWLKTRLLVSPRVRFTQFFRDENGFVGIFPEPTITANSEGERTISLMGYNFPDSPLGKMQLVSLFRASAYHVGGHVLVSVPENDEKWLKDKNRPLARFTTSLIEDVKINTYISVKYPEKLPDLASANILALKRVCRIDRLINSATRLMASLLLNINTGQIEVGPKDEHEPIGHLYDLLNKFRFSVLRSLNGENVDLSTEQVVVADEIYSALEDAGPITELPFLPHTDELGPCSVFHRSFDVEEDVGLEVEFKKCLEFLGGAACPNREETSVKTAELEAVQVFDSWERQKEKDLQLISKYENLLASTSFKCVQIPEQNYSEYLRIKSRCKSEARRLIESLFVARDAVDEDPRKLYGVLDLQEVIQVVASKSPRMDVFMLDENMSKSYSWVILIDASRSMRCVKDFALDILLIFTEVANEILIDPTSWGVYAFSDRLFIVKDLKERYNVRAKSRLGGIEFDGFTYMPDALTVAGQIMKGRSENLKLITVISDGWPCGYDNMDAALKQVIGNLVSKSITVIGIGAGTRHMEAFFKSHCTVYNLRDLNRKFSNLYFEASRTAADT